MRARLSNGMAEVCVETFKRDSVVVHDRPDSPTVLHRLPVWFNEYNEMRSHKAQ